MKAIGVRAGEYDTGQLDGYGLAAQEHAIRAFAKASGMRVKRVRNTREGGLGDHPGRRPARVDGRARAMKTGEAAALLVPNLDRLARELHIQEAALALIWKMGGRVFTSEAGEVLEDDPDDPVRRAMRQMRGVFSELEKGLIVKRLRDGRRAKANSGGYDVGAPPFGFRAEGGTLVPAADEQRAIAFMRRLDAKGKSFRQIAGALTEKGFKTKRGGTRWHPTQVARVLGRAAAA